MRVGIIPAYAGSTDMKKISDEIKEGSSPRMRGARRRDGRGAQDLRIIPAYAGSTGDANVENS